MKVDVYEEARHLARVPLLSKLDASKLKLIAFTSEQIQLTNSEYLFHINDNSDSAYLILEGEVEVVVELDTGKVEVLVVRGQGELIGEMGVISNVPRSASIRAKGKVRALRIDADSFLDLVVQNPKVSLKVMRELSDKLIDSHQKVEELENQLTKLQLNKEI